VWRAGSMEAKCSFRAGGKDISEERVSTTAAGGVQRNAGKE